MNIGTFNMTLSTPIGIKKGIINFVNEDGVLSGTIHAMGGSSSFKGGKIDGGALEFSGILRFGFYRFEYKASCTINGSKLSGTALTKFGVFEISGVKI